MNQRMVFNSSVISDDDDRGTTILPRAQEAQQVYGDTPEFDPDDERVQLDPDVGGDISTEHELWQQQEEQSEDGGITAVDDDNSVICPTCGGESIANHPDVQTFAPDKSWGNPSDVCPTCQNTGTVCAECHNGEREGYDVHESDDEKVKVCPVCEQAYGAGGKVDTEAKGNGEDHEWRGDVGSSTAHNDHDFSFLDDEEVPEPTSKDFEPSQEEITGEEAGGEDDETGAAPDFDSSGSYIPARVVSTRRGGSLYTTTNDTEAPASKKHQASCKLCDQDGKIVNSDEIARRNNQAVPMIAEIRRTTPDHAERDKKIRSLMDGLYTCNGEE